MPPLPTGTVTFLITDIEGSTRFWEQVPDAMRAALDRHDDLLRAALAAHDGHIFKLGGDAFYTVFTSPAPALAAALAIQRALQASEETEPPTSNQPRLRVRAALHTGAALERDGDYVGPSLNRAERLTSAAHGGQILLSLATAEMARDALPPNAHLRDLGAHRLKDLQRPEQIFQLVVPDLPADFPPLRSLEAFQHNLPIQLTSFIGREREKAQIRELLPTTRLLTLTGTAGAGKTRIALQTAADVLEDYPEGVWLVELAPLSSAEQVPRALAAALGLSEEPGRAPLETLTAALRSKALLLLLDNCEHLIEACAQAAETLLRACPRLRILATSREALNIAGEVAWRLPSLSLPETEAPLTPEQTLPSEAVQLFLDRAVAARPDFALTARTAAPVARVCQRLDGIPLAIELAAARVKHLPVEEITTRLDNLFQLLTGGSRTALPRQQTLQAALDWSFDLLSEAERVLLRRLSVFVGGWTLDAAESVCGAEGAEPFEGVSLLLQLVDKSLVLFEEKRGEARYRLLETMRAYAAINLRESGEEDAIRRCHLEYFLGLAEQAEANLQKPEQKNWLDTMEQEHDNLRAALKWAVDGETRLRLAGALWRFWYMRGHFTEGRAWLEGTLARSADASPAARAKALNGLGVLMQRQGDYAAARQILQESLDIRQKAGDEWGRAEVLSNLGHIANLQGDYPTARAHYAQSLETRRKLGDRWGMAAALSNLGMVARFMEEYAAAQQYYEESLTIYRALNDAAPIATVLCNLADLAYVRAEYADARRLIEESLAKYRAIENKAGIASALYNLGDIAFAQDESETARVCYEQSLRLGVELRDRSHIAYTLTGLARVATHHGDYARAATLLGAEETIRRAFQTPRPSSDNEDYERDVNALRNALSADAFQAAWGRGVTMTLEEVVSYALELKESAS